MGVYLGKGGGVGLPDWRMSSVRRVKLYIFFANKKPFERKILICF